MRFDLQIQKHIENATNKAMTELTIVTSDDSSAMRVFAFITLVLLPVTVVSVSGISLSDVASAGVLTSAWEKTVMSMNMVQFNDMPDRSGSGGNVGGNSTADQTEEPPYDFSWLMFKTWITASLILTAICIAFSWTWAEVARLKRKNEKSLRELLFPPKQPPRGSVIGIEGLGLGLGSGRPSQDNSTHGGNSKQPEPSVTGALGYGTTTGFTDSRGNDPLPRWSTAPVPGTTTSITDRRGNDALPRLSTAPVPGTSPALDTSSTAVGSSAPLQPQRGGGHVRSGSSVSQYSSQPFLAESQGRRHDSPV